MAITRQALLVLAFLPMMLLKYPVTKNLKMVEWLLMLTIQHNMVFMKRRQFTKMITPLVSKIQTPSHLHDPRIWRRPQIP
jgi:hypothetical protein